MFRGLRNWARLMRISNTLGRAKKLSEFSTLDPPRMSMRLVACSSLAELRWKSGDPEGGKQWAREVLDVCNRAAGVKELDKWRKWAREFIGPEGPPN